jgi:hypothetical protein
MYYIFFLFIFLSWVDFETCNVEFEHAPSDFMWFIIWKLERLETKWSPGWKLYEYWSYVLQCETDGWKIKLDGRPVWERSSSKWRYHGELRVQVTLHKTNSIFWLCTIHQRKGCFHIRYSWSGLDLTYEAQMLQNPSLIHIRRVSPFILDQYFQIRVKYLLKCIQN